MPSYCRSHLLCPPAVQQNRSVFLRKCGPSCAETTVEPQQRPAFSSLCGQLSQALVTSWLHTMCWTIFGHTWWWPSWSPSRAPMQPHGWHPALNLGKKARSWILLCTGSGKARGCLLLLKVCQVQYFLPLVQDVQTLQYQVQRIGKSKSSEKKK